MLYQLARSSDEATYNQHYKEIERLGGSQVKAFIDSKDKKKWVLKDLAGRRFGQITSGVKESFSNVIEVDRELSTLELLDALWRRVMNTRTERRMETEMNSQLTAAVPFQSPLRLTSYGQEQFKKTMQLARGYTVHVDDFVDVRDPNLLARVQYQSGGCLHIVQINQRTCSCRWFDDNDFPCAHAAATINKLGLDVMSYAGLRYRSINWMLSYAKAFQGPTELDEYGEFVPPEEDQYGFMHPVRIDDLLPSNTFTPLKRKPQGHMQKKRKLAGD